MAGKIFKLLYLAEILVWVGLLATLLGAYILSLLDALMVSDLDKYKMIIQVVVMVIGLIGSLLRLIAIIRGRKLSNYLYLALIFTITVSAVTVARYIIGSGDVSDLLSEINEVLEFVCSISIIYAMVDFAEAYGKRSLEESARKVGALYLILTVLTVVLDVALHFLNAKSSLIMLLDGIYFILFITAYVRYFKLLKRASEGLYRVTLVD